MTPPSDANLDNLVRQLADAAQARNIRIATAESCTGGMVAAYCTALPGSSLWFECGWITYSNAAKTRELGVAPDLIAAHGAVSEAVAGALSSGAARRAETRLAVAVSGIAGPGGGRVDKPVGTVCFGLTLDGTTHTETHRFDGDRDGVRRCATARALAWMLTACAHAEPGRPDER